MIDNFDPMQELNRAAFSNFDPQQSMSFDPEISGFDGADNYSRKPAAAIVRTSPSRNMAAPRTPEAQFDITIINSGTADLNVELFNAQNTIAEFNNTADYPTVTAGLTGNFVTIGAAPYVIYGKPSPNSASRVAYWATNGDLVLSSSAPDSTNGAVTVSCKQIPYRSLVKYSERGSFRISKMRMKFTTSAQINNDLQWRKKTFLGSTESNTISVASYFRPDQFQSLLVDVPVSVSIDAEKGLFYRINGNETVLISMFVGNYTRSAI
jgi:hypothetical protein